MTLLDIVTTVCVGLLIGTEFAVSVFVNPILERLEEQTRIRTIGFFAKRLGTAMPFWYVLSVLLLAVEAVLRRHQAGESLLVAAGAIWVAVIVLTLLFLVPINNRMMRPESHASAKAALREHKTWDILHRGRVVALTAAMVCFLLAVRA